MKSLFLAVSVVALATPTLACGEKSTKFTFEALRKREPSALRKFALWVATLGGSQALAYGGYITQASANVASIGTALHAGGEAFENDTAKDWGVNCWFYALAATLLDKVTIVNQGISKAWKTITPDQTAAANVALTADQQKANTASDKTLGVIEAVVATAALKAIITYGPGLFSAAKECAETEAKLPTAAPAA